MAYKATIDGQEVQVSAMTVTDAIGDTKDTAEVSVVIDRHPRLWNPSTLTVEINEVSLGSYSLRGVSGTYNGVWVGTSKWERRQQGLSNPLAFLKETCAAQLAVQPSPPSEEVILYQRFGPSE